MFAMLSRSASANPTIFVFVQSTNGAKVAASEPAQIG